MTSLEGYQESKDKVVERTKKWQTNLGKSRNAELRQLLKL